MSEDCIWTATLSGVGGGALGSLLTIWITHRLTSGRDSLNALRTQKVEAIPIFKKAINDCGNYDPRGAWHQHKPEVENAALSFSVLLNGRRKRSLDKAWAACDGTTEEELNTDDLRPAQKLITSRLEAVLKIIESA